MSSLFLIDLAFATLAAAAGGLGGWWLRCPASSSNNQNESRGARELLARLQELAGRIAADVGQHSSRVEEINQELTSVGGSQADVVISAVARLIDANHEMQQQLSTAEERLHEQAQLAETNAAAARTDALTSLANRRALDDELARLMAECQRKNRSFSFVLADVDHFKRFNDTHGHQAGDEVLRGMAETLGKHARDMDLVARYGGEEFALVLPDTHVDAAARFVERVRAAVDAAKFRFNDTALHVTASFGVAELLPGEDTASLIQRADEAMYAAKSAGRNRGFLHDGQTLRQIVAAPPAKVAPAAVPEVKKPAAKANSEIVKGTPGTPPRTRLCSRTEFCVTAGRRIAEWRRGGVAPAILLVRIDNYADIVTKHGQATASLVQQATSQFLMAAIREMDMAAEYARGSFAMLLPGATIMALIGIAERLRQAIGGCGLPVAGGALRFTVSVGGAVSHKGDETHTLLSRGEEALEAASKKGGDCSFFHNGQTPENVQAAMARVIA